MSEHVVTLDAEATLDIADDLMRQKRIRHIPVLRDDSPVGIVSQRDLFRAGLSSVLEFRRHAVREWLAQIKVAEVMTSDLVTIGPEAEVEQAVSLLLERRIGCVAVVEKDRLVGLLSETDCLAHLRRILAIEDVRRRIAEVERSGELI